MAFLSHATTSGGLASLAWGLSGACCSHHRVVYDASLQGLTGCLYTPGVSTFFHAAFTAHRADAGRRRLQAVVRGFGGCAATHVAGTGQPVRFLLSSWAAPFWGRFLKNDGATSSQR